MNFFSQSKLSLFVKVLFFGIFFILASKSYAEYYLVSEVPVLVYGYDYCHECRHVVHHHSRRHHHWVPHHRQHHATTHLARQRYNELETWDESYARGDYNDSIDWNYDQDQRTDDDIRADLNIDE